MDVVVRGWRAARAVALAALMMGALGSTAARAELVGHWTLDNDTTGLANLGSNGSASDLFLMGAASPVFHATGGFDGGGYATFGQNAALVALGAGNAAELISASGGYPFSFAAWARSPVPAWTNFPRGTIMALSTSSAPGDFIQMSIGFGDAGTDFESNRRFGGTTNLVDAVGSGATITDGEWHHFAAVYPDPSTLQLYVNGVLQTLSVDPVATVNYPTTINAIGIGAFLRNTTAVQDYMRGDIDDPRLFNHALTAEEVAALAGLAPAVPGDFNADGNVDGADFVIWQTNFPNNTGVATLDMGDANNDGNVDGADFVIWQTNFPTVATATPVPEPSSLVLLICTVAGAAVWVRRRRM